MTASDPRAGEIQARLDAATPGPYIEARYDHGGGRMYVEKAGGGRALVIDTFGTEGNREFFFAAPADVAYLLAELRDRDEKLAKVEELAEYLDRLALGDQYYARQIRAAIARGCGK